MTSLQGRSVSEVRYDLRSLGWTFEGLRAMRRGGVVWAEVSKADSAVSRYDDNGYAEFTIAFAGDVPAHVIVATCEAAAKGAPRSRGPR